LEINLPQTVSFRLPDLGGEGTCKRGSPREKKEKKIQRSSIPAPHRPNVWNLAVIGGKKEKGIWERADVARKSKEGKDQRVIAFRARARRGG